jgi:hypothetical protein
MQKILNKFLKSQDAFISKNAKDMRGFSRVARWILLRPQIPIWVNFGGP